MNYVNRYVFIVFIMAFVWSNQLSYSADFSVEAIVSESLEQEKALFFKFYSTYCHIPSENAMTQRMLTVAFDREQKAYQSRSTTLFFHAMIQDQVIGYISCDVGQGYKVHVRQLIIDPDYFDAMLIKELLFAIFESIPQVKSIILQCPLGCSDIQQVLESFGFTVKSLQGDSSLSLYVTYEIEVHPKCKICDVMYGDQYWEMVGHELESNDDWDGYGADMDDGYMQNGDI